MFISIWILINIDSSYCSFLILRSCRNGTFWLFLNTLNLRLLFFVFILNTFIFWNFLLISGFNFFWRNFIHHLEKIRLFDGLLNGNAFFTFLITNFKYVFIRYRSRVYILPFSIPNFLQLVKIIVFKSLRFFECFFQFLFRLQKYLIFSIFTELIILIEHLKKILILILFLIVWLIFFDLRIDIWISSFTL